MTVTFDANGGYCYPTSLNVTKGQPYGTMPTPTLSGYTFLGWWPERRSDSEEFVSDMIVPVGYDHTLYAHWAKPVYIKNYETGKYLNIYGENLTSLSSHKNVVLWDKDIGSREQLWLIPDYSNNHCIKSVIDPNYGLNVYRAGSPYNCDMLRVFDNGTDSVCTFTLIDSNRYIIKLKNYDLCLTADSNSNGANVYWAAYNNSSYQTWSFIGTETGTGNTEIPITLSMPQNLNQKYSGNDQVIINAGCAVCCACDVASYYKKSNYTLAQMRTAGVYSVNNASCVWSNVPSAKFTQYSGQSQSTYFSKMRSELNAKRPVLVYMVGTRQHWVVVYGYTGSGTSNSDFKVLDPYNSSSSTTVGRYVSLAAAMQTEGASTINQLRLTSAK
mgnify:FL=1